jgi:drug/metabolite transporter superfamily protein YnfA
MWLRQGRSPAIALLGILSLVAFAAMLTRVDAAFAGRAYAAYGGIYIAASLGWLWLVEGQPPTASVLCYLTIGEEDARRIRPIANVELLLR